MSTPSTPCPCCGRMMPTWPDADASVVKDGWTRGLTGGQIARKLGDRYSRAAVLAKVKRMGLSRRQEAA